MARLVPIILRLDGTQPRSEIASIGKGLDALNSRAAKQFQQTSNSGISRFNAKDAEDFVRVSQNINRATVENAKQSTQSRISEETKAAREVERINRETVRNARQNAKIIEQAEKALNSVRVREAKRTADDLIREIKRVSREEKTPNKSSFSSSVFKGSAVGSFVGNFASNAVVGGISLITNALETGGKAVLDYSSRMEQTKIGFETLMGGISQATAHIKELQKFATDTPFEFESLAKMSQRLQSVNVSAKDVIPLMRDIGNVTAATGEISAERVEGITTAISQMIGKTKVSAEEMEQLAERGVPAWQILAEATGKSQAELRKLSEQGKISSSVMVQALQKISREKFGDAMEKQSKTFGGAWSTIKDIGMQTAADLFKPAFEEVSKFSVKFAESLQRQETQALSVAQRFGFAIGEALADGMKRGREKGSSGGLGVPIPNVVAGGGSGIASILADLVGSAVVGYSVGSQTPQKSIADLRKLDDTVNQISNDVFKMQKIELGSADEEKKAKALKDAVSDLTSQLAFFGQTSEVAAVKQKLINQGVYDFDSGLAKSAVSLAAQLDKLKAAEKAQEEYNGKLKSFGEELTNVREKAEFDLKYPNPSELDQFNEKVRRSGLEFSTLKTEINSTREALKALAFDRAAKTRDTALFSFIEDIQKATRDLEDLNVDSFGGKLREIADALSLKGFKEAGSGIDITNQVFADKVKGFIATIKLLDSEKLPLDKIKDKFTEFLLTFRTAEGLKPFAVDQIPAVINALLGLDKAFENLEKRKTDETFKNTLSGLDEEIQKLNVDLGLSAELSRADAISKELQTKAYQGLSIEQRQIIIAKAKEVDGLRAAKEAQDKYREVLQGTTEFIEDKLHTIKDEGFKGLFKSLLQDLEDFLIKAAAKFLASKFLQFLQGKGLNIGGGSSGGGNWFSKLLGGIFGGGSGGYQTPSTFPQQFSGLETFTGNGATRPRIVPNLPITALGGLLGGHGDSAPPGGIGGAGNLLSSFAKYIPFVGAGIGIFSSLFGGLFGSAKRKRDKNENLPKLQQGFTDAFKEFSDLIADVNALRTDPDSALSKGRELRQAIATGFGVTFESRKYKKQSQELISQQLAAIDKVPDGLMEQLKKAVDISKAAGERDRRILPEFATGVYMDSAFSNQYGDFKRRNGYLTGGISGQDSLPSYLMPKEIVANEAQQDRIRRLAGFDVFAFAGIPNYPRKGQLPKFATGTFVAPSVPTPTAPAGGTPSASAAPAISVASPNITINMYEREDGGFDAYLESEKGERKIKVVVKKLQLNKEI